MLFVGGSGWLCGVLWQKMDDKIRKSLNVLKTECSGKLAKGKLVIYSWICHRFVRYLTSLFPELIHVHPQVPVLNVEETKNVDWPLTFYRDFVSKNYPVLIKNGCGHFPAVGKWSSDHFL